MPKISEEEFEQLEDEQRRHDEIIGALRKLVVKNNTEVVESLLAKQVAVLERIIRQNQKPETSEVVGQISKSVADLKELLICQQKPAVYKVVRDKQGLIEKVIKLKEDKNTND